MTIVLVLIAIVEIFVVTAYCLQRTDIIKNSIFSSINFFGLFGIISGILFWMDYFSLNRVLVGMIGVLAVILSLFLIKGNSIIWEREWKKYLFIIILLLLVFPVVSKRFGFYGMGQDEGVYQTQAVEFIMKNYQNQHFFEEYDRLDEQNQQEFIEFEKDYLAGFYLYDENLSTLEIEDKEHATAGFYHGFPTYSAMLALTGSILGMEHMSCIQTVFYICSVFMLFYVLERLGVKQKITYMLLICYAVSPMLIWVAKSTLTEMFLSCLLLVFTYYLTAENSAIELVLSVLCIWCFSLYHITIYTMIPLFIVLYIICFLYENDKRYVYAAAGSTLGFMVGINAITKVAATYSFVYNLKPLYVLNIIDKDNILPLINMVCISIILFLLCSILVIRRSGEVRIKISCRKIRGVNSVIIILLISLLMYRIVEWASKDGFLWRDLSYTTIFGFAMLAGGVLLPVIVVKVLVDTKVCFASVKNCMIYVMFVYCILIYSTVMRVEIPHYYYYGRYLVPYAFIILLMAGIVFNDIKKEMISRGIWGITLFVSLFVSLFVGLKYNKLLYLEQDDTLFSWDMLEGIGNYCEEDSIILMDKNVCMKLYLPIRAITKSEIYPVDDWEIIDSHSSNLECGKSIYYITDNKGSLAGWDTLYCEKYIMSENLNTKVGTILPYPQEVTLEEGYISVYGLEQRKYQYSIADSEIEKVGFYYSPGEKQWSVPDKNQIVCNIDKHSYTVEVIQGDYIPVDIIPNSSMQIEMIVNGISVDNYVLTKGNMFQNIVFELPQEYVEEGSNVVSFICTGWCPADYGSNDDRKLGISISEIVFTEVN